MKKQNVIDTIFFYDEVDMLIFRMTELDQYVDYFIVMESEIDFKGNPKNLLFQENQKLFELWEDKIIYLTSPSFNSELIDEIYGNLKFPKNLIRGDDNFLNKHDIKFFQISRLITHLLSLDLSFDGVIMISDVDEIPDLSKLNIIKEYLKFGPTVLRHKNFIWTTKFIDIIPNMGTVCFQFTTLITSPDLIYNTYFKKGIYISDHFDTLDNGYHFSHFYDLEKTIDKMKLLSENNLEDIESKIRFSYENLLSIRPNDNERPYNLIEYNEELPKNIMLLSNQPIGRTWSKNHLVTLNSETIPKDTSEFDTITITNFTDNYLVNEKTQISDNTTLFNIMKPSTIYYGNYDLLKFQEMFCVNEVKKISSELLPLNHDLITFINNDKSLTFKWEDIKNNPIYDLVGNIL
jgi:beta-1,4-mannosyl-glycoprotein beta-1,4-N-acetylglucosaminyltransferase